MQEITVKGIHKSLNTNGYICDVPFAARITSAIQSKPVSGAFLYGPAGTGKSFLPIVLSKTLGVEMFFYQCAPGTREDDLVLKMLPSETTKSGVEIKKSTVFKAAEASHKGKVMLVLDEWDKTRPTADGFFLDFLQYGRLSIPGTDINANLDNMFIFFTANDEREFHEALLRRFPKIDVDPLEPSLVMSALRLTHDGHPHLGNVIKLYERAVMSGMTKPATIQEIRQLLDAISFLGDGADWNSLVYQYVTKTPENHSLLKDAQDTAYKKLTTIATLESHSFTGKITETSESSRKIIMPTKIAYLTEAESIDNNRQIPSDDEIYGVYDYDEHNYSTLAHQDMKNSNAGDDVAVVDDFEVMHGKMIRKKPYQLTEMEYNQYVYDSDSFHEIAFVDTNCTFKDLQKFPKWKSFVIRRYSKDVVIARYVREKQYTIDLRWTKDSGLTIIIASNKVGSPPVFFERRSNAGQLINVTRYNTDHASAKLFLNKDNGRTNGILNIRKIIDHECIEYSSQVEAHDYPDGLRDIASDTTEMDTDSMITVYKGKGFEVTTEKTDNDSCMIARVKIFGNLSKAALMGISSLTYTMMDISPKKLGLPVYKAVKVNDTRKLTKHLKRRQWQFLGRTRGAMYKSYKSTDYSNCICYIFEGMVIFGFVFVPEHRSQNANIFSRMRRIVSQLAMSVESHG